MNLNFNFDAKTLLRNWWTIVRDNFRAVQDEFNQHVKDFEAAKKDLQNRIDTEASERKSADNALGGRIDTETSERKSADNTLGGRIDTETSERKSADNALGGRIDTETSERKNADNALGGRIDAEASERENADNELRASIGGAASENTKLQSRVSALESKSHSHDNKALLDSITGERIRKWDERTDDDSYYAEKSLKDYVSAIAKNAAVCFAELWRALGVTVYDGGIFGMEQTDAPLDGGTFAGTADNTVDFGNFSPLIIVSPEGAVIDGGVY